MGPSGRSGRFLQALPRFSCELLQVCPQGLAFHLVVVAEMFKNQTLGQHSGSHL